LETILQAFEQFLLNNNSLVLAGIVGAVVGSVLTVALLWLGKFVSRPRLRLFFNGTDVERYLPESTHPEGRPAVTVTRKYLRVSLKAVGLFGREIGGLSGARNCRIYITSIQLDGREGTDRIHDARPISWPPNKNFDTRDIPRGITMFANVVTMKQGNLGWTFQIPNTYGLRQDVLTHAGTLRIGITATAENAKPVSIHIRAFIKADKSGFEAHLE
jgi:hypothetical protein